MKIFQKNYCQIGIGDTLYIVHDNDILEQLTVTEDHLTESSYMKPNEKVIDNLYLASNYYEITNDGRLRLNTLKYIYPEHGNLHSLFKDTKLANVFIDKEIALQFIENRKLNKIVNEQFQEYPRIWVYDKETHTILDNVTTLHSTVVDYILNLDKMIKKFKAKDYDVDIAVFKEEPYHELITDLEFLNNLRKILL